MTSFARTGSPLRVMGYPPDNGSKLPLYLAQEAGIFEENGIRITFHDPGSNEKLYEGEKNGAADIYVASAVNVVGNSAGRDNLVIVANTGYHYFRFMTDASIARPEDLKGKRVATSPPGSAAALIDRIILTKLGLDPERDVTLVPFGQSSGRNFGKGGLARVNALISGEISATAVTTEGILELEKLGLDKKYPVLTDYEKLNVYTGGGGDYAVSRTFLKESRDKVKVFLRSICEAIALARKDKPKAMETLRKTMRIEDPALLDFTYRTYVERVIPERPYVRLESIEIALRITSSDADTKGTRPEDLVDLSLIRELESEGLFEQLYR